MNSNALLLDVLMIPDKMQLYVLETKVIAFGLFSILFTVAAIGEQAKIIRGEEPAFARLFYSSVLVFFTLTFAYSWLFSKLVALCEAIGLTMYNAYDWAAFQSMINPGEELKGTSIFRMGVVSLLSSIIVIVTSVAQYVFEVVRYVLLCLLYVIGPLAIVTAIYPRTTQMFKGWIVNVIQISFWIVILRIIQGVMLAINIDTINNSSIASSLTISIINLLYLILVILVPVITGKVLSGENLGSVGTAAIGLVTAATGFGVEGAVVNASGGLKGTMSGAFKGMWKGFTHTAQSHIPAGASKGISNVYTVAKKVLDERRKKSSEKKETESEEKRR